MAAFSLVASVDGALTSAFAAGCVGLPSVAVGPSGRYCARPVFSSLAAAAPFARHWSAGLGYPVAVRRVPGGWAVSVPCAPSARVSGPWLGRAS